MTSPQIRSLTTVVPALPAWASAARLFGIVSDSPGEGLLLFDGRGRCAWANSNAAGLLGAAHAGLLIGLALESILDAVDKDDSRDAGLAVRRAAAAAAGGMRERVADLHLRRRDGEPIPADIWLDPVPVDGSETGLLVTVVDARERREAEAALAASRRTLSNLLSNLPGMAYRVRIDDDDCTVDFVSEGCRDLTGRDPAEVIGTQGGFLTRLAHPDDRARMAGKARECMASGRPYQLTYRIVTSAGEVRWVWEQGRGVFDDDGRLLSVEGFVTDVTEAHDLSEKLSHQATHDALTDLYNRRAFEQRLGEALERSRGDGSRHAFCYLDLDQFKVVNDTCGHVAGDELLRQLARGLAARVRRNDTLARLGGDEFGVLMEDCDLDQARRVANALRASVQEFRFVWDENSFAIGASIGVVPIDCDSESATEVLKAADAACYAAKDAGRDRIHFYDAEDADVVRRHGEMKWVARINAALEDDRLALHGQTIRAIGRPRESGPEPLHFEVLIRMIAEDGSLIPPGAFLPAAERYGLASRIDRWTIHHALRWLAEHPEILDRLHTCAFNLSGHTLGDDEFLAFIGDELDATGVPADRICFEITETMAIANLTSATRLIRALKERGSLFALDDFGSGLSSFAYLKTLPVDFLKIDGLFVKDILDDPIDLAMVKSINEIGQVMGKRTIAEFVENDAILGALQGIGVDYAQGYGIDRPRPLEDFA